MKLKINKACDLSSISVLPPRRSGGGGMGAGASQQSFSYSQSQLSQASLDDSLLNHNPTTDQRTSSHDDLSKRISSLPASSSTREESQLQLSKVSGNSFHRWNTAPLPDNRCQAVSEELERKFQHLSSSVHRMGMVLDSLQNDVMQMNRAVKELLLDTGGIRQKVLPVDSSLQQILKGEDDTRALLEGGLKSIADHLKSISDQLTENSNSSKLNEMSSALSCLQGQMQADLGKMQSDICKLFTKEMEGVVRAVRSLNSRPAAVEPPANQGFTSKEQSLRSQIPVTEVPPAPLAGNIRRFAAPKVEKIEEGKLKVLQQKLTGSSHIQQKSTGSGHLQQKLTGSSHLQQKLTGSSHLQQKLTGSSHLQQKLTGSSRNMPPKCDQAAIRKEQRISIIIDSDDESEGGPSCLILKKETGDMDPNWMRQARQESLQILRRARKRKRREMNSIVIV